MAYTATEYESVLATRQPVAGNATNNYRINTATDRVSESTIHNASTVDWSITDDPSGDASTLVCDVSAVVYSIIGTIGIIDNAFVLVVMFSYPPMMKQLNNFYIINQSIIDLFVCVFLLCHIPDCMYSPMFEGISGDILCRVWRTKLFLWGLLMVSTNNIVAIAIDRLLSIVYPVWYKTAMTRNTVCRIISVVWILGIGYMFSFGIGTSGVTKSAICIVWDLFPSQSIGNFLSILYFLASFPIPVSIMLICYVRMLIVFKTRVHPTIVGLDTENERQTKTLKVRMNIFKTMATISIIFVLCWFCITTWYLMKSFGYPFSRTNWFYHISVYTCNVNSIINPFIYIAKYTQFQKGLKILISRSGWCNKWVTTSTTTTPMATSVTVGHM